MCGIAGFYDPQLSSGGEGTAVMQHMLKAQAHRGPDNTDHWQAGPLFLGHNRLSIIDLSSEADQPFQSDELTLIFNGEIYNYLELRQELLQMGYRFKTQSDTEVICVAYRAWGDAAVKRFVGMWSFALWDAVQQRLFCSRDRFGIKPFQYLQEGERFYFASELKALKASPLFNNDINERHIERWLQLGWLTYGEESFFKAVKNLPPAHNLIFQNGGLKLERYWRASTAQSDWQEAEAIAAFKARFRESVHLHMRADTPVGGCLSGGLDSSAICSVVGQDFQDTPFNTFTIFYDEEGGVDERPHVQAVLDRYPSLKPHYYSPDSDALVNSFERFMHHFDLPPSGSSPISQYFVMQLAGKQGMKVLLDGQGADEYLAGYDHSVYRLVGQLMRDFKWAKAHRELRGFMKAKEKAPSAYGSIFTKSMASAFLNEEQLYQLELDRYHPYLPQQAQQLHLEQPREGSKLNEFLYQLTFQSSLPTLLHNEDRNSMAFSIESRVPFLDHRLVELGLSFPDHLKYRLGHNKYVLRKALPEYLPSAITERLDKKGFVTPGESKWLRGPLKGLLEGAEKLELPFLRQDRKQSLLEDYRQGNDKNAKQVWRLAVLSHWLKNI